MEEEIRKNLICGNYEKVDELVKNMSISELRKLILDRICFNKEELSTYTYIQYRILNASSSELYDLHMLACGILIIYFTYVEGAYASGLYHAKKALELEPNNPDAIKVVLDFWDLPEGLHGERLISKKYAKELAQHLLEIEPESEWAKEILEN
ncbi:MAG: hypothetical protein IJJ82_00445 [Clostridia bacterium]|nr:hypothetical protein [Clostridia bacterium]